MTDGDISVWDTFDVFHWIIKAGLNNTKASAAAQESQINHLLDVYKNNLYASGPQNAVQGIFNRKLLFLWAWKLNIS